MFTTFVKTQRQDLESLLLKQTTIFDFSEDNESYEENQIPRFVTVKHDRVFDSTMSYIERNKLNDRANALVKKINDYLEQIQRAHPNSSLEDIIPKLYYMFQIPKKKGGFRDITAISDPEFANLQKDILFELTEKFKILPHNASFAYVKGRNSIMNAAVHKHNTFVIGLDFKNFFPSITKQLVYKALMSLSVFNGLEQGKELAEKIALISTLNDGLPQGSHLSPFLSNIVMIPFDYRVYEDKKKGVIHNYMYTRYADDLTMSCNNPARIGELINYVENLLEELYGGQIKLNREKSKVIKNTSRLYVTGVKLNKDNQATFGHEKKSELKLEICNMFIAHQNNECCKEQVQEILGRFAYMSQIEPQYGKYIANKYLRKFNSNSETLAGHFKQYL